MSDGEPPVAGSPTTGLAVTALGDGVVGVSVGTRTWASMLAIDPFPAISIGTTHSRSLPSGRRRPH